MKVVHLNTFDCGGAALSCIRLHQALLDQGVDSTLLTLEENSKRKIPRHFATSIDRRTIPQRIIRKLAGPSRFEIKDELVQRLHIPSFDLFSNPESLVNVLRHPAVRAADVVNLHWVARFVDYASFFRRCNKPVVWTLHDQNAFTGGCHYSMGCDKYTRECFDCPQIAPSNEDDIVKENFQIKARALRGVRNIQVVAPSQWLIDCAARSALFKRFDRQVIRYGLDVGVFREYDRAKSRAQFNIPQNKRIILFVADYLDNERKGIRLFVEAVVELIAAQPDVACCFVGHQGGDLTKSIPGALHLGRIDEPSVMAQAFAAADVFALPSLEDNLPNTMLESMCCGTPVVAFNSGGTAEIIRDRVNGFIASAKTPDSLKAALATALESKWNRCDISRHAREMFEPSRQAKSYLELYAALLGKA